jgi:hypothetical protein
MSGLRDLEHLIDLFVRFVCSIALNFKSGVPSLTLLDFVSVETSWNEQA